MQIEVSEHPFSPWEEIAAKEKLIAAALGQIGATSVFVGTMRDFNQESSVFGLFLEHYPGMTESVLQNLVDDAIDKYQLQDAWIRHRVGEIHTDDTIVAVVTWSSHRKESIAACNYLIETLKHKAPFWKREQTEKGERWVSENTPGYQQPLEEIEEL